MYAKTQNRGTLKIVQTLVKKGNNIHDRYVTYPRFRNEEMIRLFLAGEVKEKNVGICI